MKFLLRSAMALLVVCLLSTDVVADNLVLNSGLDKDVFSWRPEVQTAAEWSADDATGDAGSGSIEIHNQHQNASFGRGVEQCLPLVPIPGTNYEYGGRAKIPAGQDRTGWAMVGARFYDGPHCSGGTVGSQPRRSTSVVGSWVELASPAEVVPEGALSVMFKALPSKVEAEGTLTALFDDLYFRITMPFTDDFETGDSSAWSQTVPAVITARPVVDASKILNISRVFCKSGFCPWPGDPYGAHDGLDFTPTEDLVAFQASCDGEVFSVDPFLNVHNGLYQVNVGIACSRDATHGVVYAFEPFTDRESDRDLQLANIAVEVGDPVAAGDLIGHLVRAEPAGAHVHYGVFLMGPIGQICPAPLFSPAVSEQLLDIIHIDHPDWGFCH